MQARTPVLVLACVMVAAGLAGCVATTSGSADPDVKEIRMWVEQMDWEIHPGVNTTVWAFCAEGDGVEPVHGEEACGVPGPTIRVQEGDLIRLTFENTHSIAHTVHFHGWHPFEADMNGNPLVGDAMVVEPQETQVIEWVAEPAGSFIYHCHFQTPTHMEMGMYGGFIVEDPYEHPAFEPDVDHMMVLDEWAISDEASGFDGAMPYYDYFTINGKSFPLVDPIVADAGDKVRVHMVNAGYKFRAMHLHGYTPDSWEGVAGPEHAVPTDVRMVAPGQTVVLDFAADREGVWLFHDHVVPHVTAAASGDGFGAYPRGMLTVLVVGDTYAEALESIVPDLLAAAKGDVADPGASHGDHDHGDDAGDSDATVVRMVDLAYEPETLEIEAGTTVRWVNDDSFYHTVTFEDGSVDSGRIEAGQSWSYTFEEPGTYEYYCVPHAYQDDDGNRQGMTGTVVVK